jgi:RNA polymerase sigma-70 factor (ECF subfamily)
MTISPTLDAETYARHRPLLFAIAYRMLGSASEAEDIVQEAFLRYHRSLEAGQTVDSPRAYLSAVTTRLAIDNLRSARARRERYVGQWLPEPLLTGGPGQSGENEVERHAEMAESLSMAFLVLLERLSPLERAVFLLHEVFDYGYAEIGGMLGRGEAAVRQVGLRARHHVAEGRPRFEPDRESRDQLARRFFAALQAGDVEGLVATLAPDVEMCGDGGGKSPASPEPIRGAGRASRVLMGLVRQGARFQLRIRPEEVNGQAGAVITDSEGRLVAVMALEIADGAIRGVRSVANPDKLRHLGPVVDFGELLRAAHRAAGES